MRRRRPSGVTQKPRHRRPNNIITDDARWEACIRYSLAVTTLRSRSRPNVIHAEPSLRLAELKSFVKDGVDHARTSSDTIE